LGKRSRRELRTWVVTGALIAAAAWSRGGGDECGVSRGLWLPPTGGSQTE